METNTKELHLYEALELRAEYKVRITTIKDCLAGNESGGKRASFWRDDKNKFRPSPDFDVGQEREALELRKGLTAQTAELKTQAVEAAHQTVKLLLRPLNSSHSRATKKILPPAWSTRLEAQSHRDLQQARRECRGIFVREYPNQKSRAGFLEPFPKKEEEILSPPPLGFPPRNRGVYFLRMPALSLPKGTRAEKLTPHL